jgi:hypothetical protein
VTLSSRSLHSFAFRQSTPIGTLPRRGPRVVRRACHRPVPARSGVREPHSPRRQAGGSSSASNDEIRACDQSQDGEGSRPRDPEDTRALQHYLGHKNIQHTVRYTELSPDRFRDFWRVAGTVRRISNALDVHAADPTPGGGTLESFQLTIPAYDQGG